MCVREILRKIEREGERKLDRVNNHFNLLNHCDDYDRPYYDIYYNEFSLHNFQHC